MRLLSTDPSEPGFFAVGQFAYGVIAIGQVATGVIAIGQVARGVVAIGQAAVGLVVIGQGAVGLFFGVGMIGIFGRGWPLPLVPKLPVPRQLPATTDMSQLRMGYGDGWIEAELKLGLGGAPVLSIAGAPIDRLKLAAPLVPVARAEIERYFVPEVIAHVRSVGEVLVCDRLLHVPLPITQKRNFKALTLVRMILLVVVALGVWLAIWPPIAALLG